MKPLKETVRSLVPNVMRAQVFSVYHFLWAWVSSILYRNPSKDIFVLGITGTKGKTTTVELIRTILEHEGYRVATTSTLHFTIDNNEIPNKYKMSMPGRTFMQKFLRKAVSAGCDYAILELTSEGAVQHRHRFIDLDAFMFTNLSPEHIESHGSYEAYRDAKLTLAHSLERSGKKNKTIIVNADDKEASRFMGVHVPIKKQFKQEQAQPIEHTDKGIVITYEGFRIPTNLKGNFDVYNLLAAITFARSQNISIAHIAKALSSYKGTRGRMEYVHNANEKIPYSVVVDYAHTPNSLDAVYESIEGEKICVFGATGGGRDKWKRKEFGKIAQKHCSAIFLTNEDPYDENPRGIVDEIAEGLNEGTYNIVMDRREAMRKAMSVAPADSTVVITGKGTDPYIMGPDGTKEPWDDAQVAREELH